MTTDTQHGAWCVCGHHSHDHASDPSGLAGSRCWHADTYDALDYPAAGACNCRDYNPQEENK